MADLDRIREKFPDLNKYEYSDAEVINWMAGQTGRNPQELSVLYGVTDPNQGDFSRGFDAAIDSTKALGGGLVGMAGDAVGADGLRDWGVRGYQRNMAGVGLNARATDSTEGVNSVGDAVDFSQYWLGYAVPQVAQAVVSGGVGGMLGKQAVKGATGRMLASEVGQQFPGLTGIVSKNLMDQAAKRGAIAGLGAQAYGSEFGAIYGDAAQNALDQGKTLDDVNLGRVAAGGLAAGSLEFATDVATLGLARIGPGKRMFDMMNTGSRTANAAIRGATGFVGEGLTEMGQTGIEEMGAGKTFQQANFSDPTSFFAGGVGGGAMGLVGGVMAPTNKLQEQPTSNPTASPDTQQAIADGEQQRQSQEEADRQAQLAKAEADARLNDRFDYAPTFIDEKTFVTEKQNALFAEMDDQNSELGQQWRQWRINSGMRPAATEAQVKSAQNKFLQGLGMDFQAMYDEALDAHVAYKKGEAQRTPEVAAQIAKDKERLLGELAAETKAQNIEGIRLVNQEGTNLFGGAEWNSAKYDTAGLTQSAKNAAKAAKEAEQRAKEAEKQAKADAKAAKVAAQTGEQPATTPTTVTAEDVAPAAPGLPAATDVAKVTTPFVKKGGEGKVVADARAYAEKIFGPNWGEIGTLANDFEQRVGFYDTVKNADGTKRRKWEKIVDEEFRRYQAEQQARTPAQETAPAQPLALETPAADTTVATAPATTTEATEAPPTDAATVTDEENAKALAAQEQKNAELRKQGVAYAEYKLGKNWAEIVPELADRVATNQFGGFTATVDRAVAQQQERQLTSGAETNTPTVETPRDLAVSQFNEDGLTENQTAVWKVLQSAFMNNETDPVINADGSFNFQKIAEMANLKVKNEKYRRQAANTALKQLRPKIAAAFNVSEAELATALAQTRKERQKVEAYDPNAPVSVVDEAELGVDGGFGTTDRPDKTAYEGVSEDDKKFIQARSQEKDNYESKRQELADQNRQRAVTEMVKEYGRAAIDKWMDLTSGTVAPTQLTKSDLIDWISSYEEYANNQITSAQLAQEQKDIEARAANGTAIESTGTQAEARGQTTPAITDETGDGNQTSPQGGGQTDQVGTQDSGQTQQRATPAVVVKKKRSLGPKMGVSTQTANPYTADELRTELEDFVRSAISESKLLIVDNVVDLLSHPDRSIQKLGAAIVAEQLRGNTAYGVADNGQAVLIADRIEQGQGRAKFLHEVGSHLGLDTLLPKETYDSLVNQIKEWVNSEADTDEVTLAARAQLRLEMSGTIDENQDAELLAYFIEEASLAGIDPTAADQGGPVQQWFKKLWSEFKRALTKLGLQPSAMTAEDIVNLAFGAAQLELSTAEVNTGKTTPKFGVTGKAQRVQTPKEEGTSATSRLGQWAEENLGPAARKAVDDFKDVASFGVESLKFLHQKVRESKSQSLKDMYRAIKEADKTRNDIRRSVEAIAVRARNLSPERLKKVNEFIGDSTFQQKWGYTPSWKADDANFTPDGAMAERFNRLEQDAQQLIVDVFQHGENMRQRKVEIAKALGVPGRFFSDASLDGPYAPLKRFGNYVVVLRSNRLIALEKLADANPNNKELAKQVEALKQSGDHYIVSMFDTMGSAKQFRDITQKTTGMIGTASRKKDDPFQGRVTNAEVFQKILGSLKASDNSKIDAKSKQVFTDMLKQMYFQSLDERDARLSGAKRKNRAGYEQNMIRSFLSHARAEAALVSTMENGAAINEAFSQLSKEADRDPETMMTEYDMMKRHYADMMSFKETPIQDRIAAMNSVWMLTTSLGYHITNATQPIMVTLPRLAGDFKNYNGAWGSLIRAYKIGLGMATINKSLQTEIDIEKAPQRYRKMLEELQLRGLLDVGMEEDLSSFDRFNTGYEGLNKASDMIGKVTHKLYQVARYVEAQNRISSAIAAYELAQANPAVARRQGMSAEEYATAVVEDTQGNFSRMDAPLLIKALPKVTTQYRKYQLMMAWAYANATKQAFNGESPEMKAMGRRTLGYMLGHAGMFAGAVGVPLVSTIAPYVLAFTNDGDEPEDLERWIRRNVDGPLGDVLSRGVFSLVGIDMSGKLSQAKIFSPFPYVDYSMTEDGFKDLVFNAVAGPAGTTGLNFTRAAQYYAQGDVLKGMEYTVPKGLRSMIETFRLASEGFSFKNGDVVLDPRAINVWSLMVNATGLQSSQINNVKWTRGQQYELETWFSEESGRLRRDYVEAYRNRDTTKMNELRQDWRDLQESKDRVRPFFNNSRKVLKRQPLSDLIRAPREQRQRETTSRLQLGTG